MRFSLILVSLGVLALAGCDRGWINAREPGPFELGLMGPQAVKGVMDHSLCNVVGSDYNTREVRAEIERRGLDCGRGPSYPYSSPSYGYVPDSTQPVLTTITRTQPYGLGSTTYGYAPGSTQPVLTGVTRTQPYGLGSTTDWYE